MVKVILKKGREESVIRFHPWIYSGAVAQIVGSPLEGDLVSVCSYQGEILATGHFQSGPVAVRILSFDSDCLKPDFYEVMIRRAYNLRLALGIAGNCNNQTGQAYRLVNGEGDNLPGLTVDFYDGVCVIKAHSAGIFRARKSVCDALMTVYGDQLKAVYDRSASQVLSRAGIDAVNGYIWRAPDFEAGDYTVIEEGDMKYRVNWTDKGFSFPLDLRDGRKSLHDLAAGREVLSLYSGVGAFAVAAMAGGAVHVDCVDSSAWTVRIAENNAAANDCDDSLCDRYVADPMDFLKMSEYGKYNLMVVNPPAFAKHKGAFASAMAAYRKLNQLALEKVRTGGLVFTYSCSNVVGRTDFVQAVFAAAAKAGRSVRVIGQLGLSADHPVNVFHQEGDYLKGLILFVE